MKAGVGSRECGSRLVTDDIWLLVVVGSAPAGQARLEEGRLFARWCLCLGLVVLDWWCFEWWYLCVVVFELFFITLVVWCGVVTDVVTSVVTDGGRGRQSSGGAAASGRGTAPPGVLTGEICV